jgi:hypothetical protein
MGNNCGCPLRVGNLFQQLSDFHIQRGSRTVKGRQGRIADAPLQPADVRLLDTHANGDSDNDPSPYCGLDCCRPPRSPAGGRPTRTDLAVTGTVTSFALPFVEHCVQALKPGGHAAIVVPDGILHEEGRGRALRTFLMQECELHTILRLPSSYFEN